MNSSKKKKKNRGYTKDNNSRRERGGEGKGIYSCYFAIRSSLLFTLIIFIPIKNDECRARRNGLFGNR